MALEEYRKKRKFQDTPEPAGAAHEAAGGKRFVIQKHDATRLHYDLRLEIDGVMPSWAVPKGPSLNPADKRLAMRTEDHPLDYATFEGVIPEGNYGAGAVMIWDNGTFLPEGGLSAAEQLRRGEIKFQLHGRKLRGSWVLVRTRSSDPKKEQWLLIKHRDDAVDPAWNIEQQDWSVLTGRSLREIENALPPRPEFAGELPGAKKASMPATLEPMLATLVEKPFSNPDWLFELKWDGMRLLSYIRDGNCELQSRRGRKVTSQFPEIAGLPSRIAAREAIVDGEAVVLGEGGLPDFQRMQGRMNVAQPSRALLEEAPIVYYVFDLLYCDGYDLRSVPLVERKEFLKRMFRPDGAFRYSDHVIGRGEDLYSLATERRIEGIIGKYARGRYVSGRTPEWVKVKAVEEVDAVVGGYTAPRGSRGHFGALLLGLYEDDGRLRYIGGCGTGFTERTQSAVMEQLEKLTTAECPFAERPQTREAATWVKPALVARVKFREWTRDSHLRAPVFLGLRPDVDPADCRFRLEQPAASPPIAEVASGREPERDAAETDSQAERDRIRAELCRSKAETVNLEVNGRRLRLTHLNKVYFPREGLTKRDLLCYYVDFADLILPFLRDRPLVLRRRPDGMAGELFYQKDAREIAPDWMTTVPVRSQNENREVHYAVANDLASLLYLTNLGCIDHNPWSSRAGDLEHPDYIFFDLDPTEQTPYSTVAEVGKAVYGILDSIGLKTYVKTSGASGLHLYLPVEPVYTYDQVRPFTEIIMRLAAARVPDKTTFERTVQRRPPGRVLLDFSQISYSRPLAAVYSVRPVEGAWVSAPILPRELTSKLNPARFTMKTMRARVKKVGDLWADFWEHRQQLEPALERLRSEFGAPQVSASRPAPRSDPA
jgi:bifunctional non-homologous end joining protein LigD